MKRTPPNLLNAAVLAVMLSTASIAQQVLAQTTPGYNHKIPEQIMTPDKVQTRIGTLEFFDGMPSKATVEKTYDNLDLMRGVETFLSGMPAASVEAMRLGMLELGIDASNKVGVAQELLDSTPLFLTGNTDTVYTIAIMDLKRDGATVVEVPPGSGPGTVDDAYFRFVVDMGAPGPDKGKGGKWTSHGIVDSGPPHAEARSKASGLTPPR